MIYFCRVLQYFATAHYNYYYTTYFTFLGIEKCAADRIKDYRPLHER